MSPPMRAERASDPMYVQPSSPHANWDDVILPLSTPPPTSLAKGSFSNHAAQKSSEVAQRFVSPGLDISLLDSLKGTVDVSSDSIATKTAAMETEEPTPCSPTTQKAAIENGSLPKKKSTGIDSRWWTKSGKPLMCPLTNFPINLLPYPPFKLRIDPERPNPHKLVDGKFLAMQVISTGNFVACGRTLQQTDMQALDAYCHRCRLGPFRPGKAMALWKEVQKTKSDGMPSQEALQATQELTDYVKSSRVELGKLRRIQENRMVAVQEQRLRESSGKTDVNRSHSSTNKGVRHVSSAGGKDDEKLVVDRLCL